MIERILLILKTKNISPSQFADEINVQRSNISHIISGRNKPSLEFVKKILDRYKEINTEWLINGVGPMLKESTVLSSEPDLFSPVKRISVETAEKQGNNAVLEETKDTENTSNEENSFEQTGQINDKEFKNDHSMISSDIEQIVIFFKDKTYTAYKQR